MTLNIENQWPEMIFLLDHGFRVLESVERPDGLGASLTLQSNGLFVRLTSDRGDRMVDLGRTPGLMFQAEHALASMGLGEATGMSFSKTAELLRVNWNRVSDGILDPAVFKQIQTYSWAQTSKIFPQLGLGGWMARLYGAWIKR